MPFRSWGVAFVAAALLALPSAASIEISPTASAIAVDGVLQDSEWSSATRVETFFEHWTTDNEPAPAATVAFITYDENAIYVAFDARDSAPKSIRAPYVDRDRVGPDQDWVGILLSTGKDRRSGVAFRVNARGIQTDAVRTDGGDGEDYSPDFFYDAEARITEQGWTAEMRIPLSSLRYSSDEGHSWGVLLERNYPRDYRYLVANARIPKDSNCYVCHAVDLKGLSGLKSGDHLVIAPYTTAGVSERRASGAALDSPLEMQGLESELGLDLKWMPSPRFAFDLALNPDFSQIESDVPQIAVNNRFALSFPEKRPFFLEGVDLLTTIIPAVYTRSIASPKWGARSTGRLGANEFTLLVTEDRGGGAIVVPGPLGSDVLSLDSSSLAIVGRGKRSFGRSHAGVLFTSRETDEGSNRVFGPDFEWNPTQRDRVRGQFLMSWSDNPLDERFGADAGQSRSAHAAVVNWSHRFDQGGFWFWSGDYADGFRADNGFVPQAGFRYIDSGFWRQYNFEGSLKYLEPWLSVRIEESQQGERLAESVTAGVYFRGKWNSDGWMNLEPERRERVLGEQIGYFTVSDFGLRARPSRRLSLVQLTGSFGERIDYAHARLGTGASLSGRLAVRPNDHLELELNSQASWLDLNDDEASGRLFLAHIQRLKATYVISSKSLVRAIAQYGEVDRARDLYRFPVNPRAGSLGLSLLYGYRLNWQTLFFVGYGDEQHLDHHLGWTDTGRSLFLKVSYAYQR